MTTKYGKWLPCLFVLTVTHIAWFSPWPTWEILIALLEREFGLLLILLGFSFHSYPQHPIKHLSPLVSFSLNTSFPTFDLLSIMRDLSPGLCSHSYKKGTFQEKVDVICCCRKLSVAQAQEKLTFGWESSGVSTLGMSAFGALC